MSRNLFVRRAPASSKIFIEHLKRIESDVKGIKSDVLQLKEDVRQSLGEIEPSLDSRLEKFKESLISDPIESDIYPEVKYVSFAEPIPEPFSRGISRNELVIRHDYEGLWIELLKMDKSVYIVGTPGIGKSFFLIYILRKLLIENPDRTIIYSSNHSNAIVFRPGEIKEYCMLSAKVCHYLNEEGTVWLMDGKEHGNFESSKCRKILCASNRDQNVNVFKKTNAKKCVLPCWNYFPPLIAKKADPEAIGLNSMDEAVKQIPMGDDMEVNHIPLNGRTKRKAKKGQAKKGGEGADSVNDPTLNGGKF